MDLKDALHILKEKGYKHTDKREEMLSIFAQEKRYLSAKDVLDRMQNDFPGLSFDTIYRNLSLFVELNVLEMTELEGEKRFRFSCDTKSHHHHVICLSCGKTAHIHSCPMTELKVKIPDFDVTGHKFEIYGHCQSCQWIKA